MKKYFALLLTVAMLLSLAACGTKAPTTTEATVPAAATTTTQPTQPTTVAPRRLSLSDIDTAALSSIDNTGSGFGQGVERDDKNRPTGCTMLQAKYEDYDVLFIAPESEGIYLTFDQGYEAGYTESILDTLKEKGVHAVFFCTMDYVEDEPELIQRMIDEGHVVGNHSANHKSMPSLSVEEQAEEIIELHNYMVDNYNYEMIYFRPPSGEYSERSIAVAEALGYTTMFWSFAYVDWETDNQPEQQASYEKIVSRAHNGAIYLLHAVSSTNTAILGDVIDAFKDAGYSICEYSNER